MPKAFPEEFRRDVIAVARRGEAPISQTVADHYGVDPENYPPDATTLDYVVAAAGG